MPSQAQRAAPACVAASQEESRRSQVFAELEALMAEEARKVPPALWIPACCVLLFVLACGACAAVFALWADARPTPPGLVVAVAGSLVLDWLIVEPGVAFWSAGAARKQERRLIVVREDLSLRVAEPNTVDEQPSCCSTTAALSSDSMSC